MKKPVRTFLTTVLLLSANVLYAQVIPAVSTDTSTTEGLLHYILEPIDKLQIPTGFLAAWGVPILPMATFNGTLTDSNQIDMNLWRTLYFQLQTSYCGNGSNPLDSITVVNDSIRQNMGDSLPVPVPLLIGHYNSVRSNAFSSNLLSYNSSQNQVHDVPGRAQSPYQLDDLFAASPNSDFTTSGTVTFVCKSSLVWNNTGKSINSIQIDFDNGEGFKNMTMNAPVTVSYSDTGTVRWTIKATLSDNSVLQCYSKYHVLKTAAIAPMYTGGNGWDNRWIVPETANHHGATVFISYTSKDRTNTMRKPLIVVEGYDVSSVAPGIQNNYSYTDFVNAISNEPGNVFDFNHQLDDIAGYDLVFIDFKDGTDDIRRNAALVEHIIDLVNAAKATAGSTEQNVVMGLSMGGLVARYALAEMTKNSEDPETRLLITHDSPHRGANVPLGIQYFLQMFGHLKLFGTTATSIYPQYDQLINLLDRQATQQMLIYRATGPDAYVNNTFLDGDYHNMVTFNSSDPQPAYRFIATSLGSQCGQQLFSPGKTFFNLGAGVGAGIVARLFFFRAPIATYKFAVDAEAYALPASGVHKIAKFYAVNHFQLFGFIDIVKQLYSNTAYSSGSQLPVDGVAGATYPLLDIEALKQINNIPHLPPVNLTINLPLFSIFGAYFDLYAKNEGFSPQFCFVPTASALDTDPFNMAATSAPYVSGYNAEFISGSDNYIAQESMDNGVYNNAHIRFTARNAEWLYDEMEEISNTLNCSTECSPNDNFVIKGNKNLCSNATYLVSDLSDGSTISWSASPAGLVSLLPDGDEVSVTKIDRGSVELMASINNGCGHTFSISKTIQVGTPYIDGPAVYNTDYGGPYPLLLRLPFGNHPIPNEICEGYGGHTQVNIVGASLITWNKTGQSEGASITWNQDTHNQLHFWIHGSQNWASFAVDYKNACGSGSIPYEFKAVSCNPYPPHPNKGEPVFKVYPNPTNDKINLEKMENEKMNYSKWDENLNDLNFPEIPYRIRIYNVTGDLVKSKSFSSVSQKIQIDVSDLSVGTYFLEINKNNSTKIETHKILIRK